LFLGGKGDKYEEPGNYGQQLDWFLAIFNNTSRTNIKQNTDYVHYIAWKCGMVR
jgi:hypothetical protein